MLIKGRDLLSVRSCYRSGVIPFTKINNKVYFLLAVDFNTGDLSDFGGGCKKNENLVTTAFRELNEESYGLFVNMSEQILYNSFAIVNHKRNSAVFFMYIDSTWFTNVKDAYFIALLKTSDKFETKDIKWISEEEFKKLIYSIDSNWNFPKDQDCQPEEKLIVWDRLKKFLTRNISFELLKSKLLEIS
jgi:hypothetical protein